MSFVRSKHRILCSKLATLIIESWYQNVDFRFRKLGSNSRRQTIKCDWCVCLETINWRETPASWKINRDSGFGDSFGLFRSKKTRMTVFSMIGFQQNSKLDQLNILFLTYFWGSRFEYLHFTLFEIFHMKMIYLRHIEFGTELNEWISHLTHLVELKQQPLRQ